MANTKVQQKRDPTKNAQVIDTFNPPPYRRDSATHLSRASSLANLLWGMGIDNFTSCSHELQDDVLWLLADELDQGIAALEHEKNVGQVS